MLWEPFDRIWFSLRPDWLSYSQVQADKDSIVGKPQIVTFTINLLWPIYETDPIPWMKIWNILKALPFGADGKCLKSLSKGSQNVFLVLMYHFTHNSRWSGTAAQSKNLSVGHKGVTTASGFLPLCLAGKRWNLKPSRRCSSTVHQGGSKSWLVFGFGLGQERPSMLKTQSIWKDDRLR